jgi:hypothetical protein
VTNIVYFDTGVLLGSSWGDDKFRIDWNDYWDTRTASNPASIHLGPVTWDKWKERGFDTHSVLADPLFVDPKGGDFGLRPESPALKLGFKPIDLRQVGPRGEKSEASSGK